MNGTPTADRVDSFARVALTNITRPFPYAAHHVQADDADLLAPARRHPAFANSFDWHSSVHMHWLLTTLVGRAADSPREWTEKAVKVLVEHLGADNLRAEAHYLQADPTWERPYGWAWATYLYDALASSPRPELKELAGGARVLFDAVAGLALDWPARMPEPVRHGVHTNTAFGMRRIRRAAATHGRDDVVESIDAAARRFYLADAGWAFDQERSGQDFLSPGLCEADLMIDVLGSDELTAWLPAFLSRLRADSAVLTPVPVLDPTDGFQSHLNGLGLTASASGLRVARALRRIHALPDLADALVAAAPGLMVPGLGAAVSDQYMDGHWLATFAWEALVEAVGVEPQAGGGAEA